MQYPRYTWGWQDIKDIHRFLTGSIELAVTTDVKIPQNHRFGIPHFRTHVHLLKKFGVRYKS